MLLDTQQHAPILSRSLLSPRWMGPFKVLARTTPNTYPSLIDIHATWRACNEFNVEHLWKYLRCPDHLGSDVGPPAPVVCADGWPEYEVQELLKFKMRYGQPYLLVRWAP